MKLSNLTSDVRVQLFVFVALVASLFAAVRVRFYDIIDGGIDAALGEFNRLDAKLDRARMAAVRKANAIDARAAALAAQVEALDDEYDAKIEAIERAARVQQRIAALLD